MRITGGTWRGRRIDSVPGGATRPTTDRVREALFNIVRADIHGADVVDCCCGSGALGLEALSRGARTVEFVDIAPAALKVVRANLDRCGADPQRWTLRRADAVRRLVQRLTVALEPLVILADPPYGGPVASRLVDLATGSNRVALLAVEHGADESLSEACAEGWIVDVRRYGNTALTLLRPSGAEAWREFDG